MFEYDAKLIRVVDGDTVELAIDLGFRLGIFKESFRLYGVDAYEVSRRGSWDDGLTEEEVQAKLELGRQATELVKSLLENAQSITVKSYKDTRGKYGRWLAELIITTADGDVVNINKRLLAEGLAKEYVL